MLNRVHVPHHPSNHDDAFGWTASNETLATKDSGTSVVEKETSATAAGPPPSHIVHLPFGVLAQDGGTHPVSFLSWICAAVQNTSVDGDSAGDDEEKEGAAVNVPQPWSSLQAAAKISTGTFWSDSGTLTSNVLEGGLPKCEK